MKTLLPRSAKSTSKPLTYGVLAIATVTLLGGCAQQQAYSVPGGCCKAPIEEAPKSYVVLIPSPDGTVGEIVVKGASGEQVLNKAGQAGTIEGQALQVDDKRIKGDFGDTIAALPKIPVHYLLYFSSGTTLSSASNALLPEIIAEAKTRPAVDISVIGHTDTLSSDAYNDKLALKRATRVSELLEAKGLKANSLIIESHGEKNLLVKTPDNTREPKNRRVEVSVR
jgi:peptidoglycan-associated lipoprotein